MSDSTNNPGPPPDDFSKTRPNVKIPDSGEVDWDKTNYNFPKVTPSDDWGKTVTNIKPIETGAAEFGKPAYPGAKDTSDVDWGATRANIGVPDTDFGQPAGESDYGKTTPYFQLPEAERAKYQNLPPTPAEQAAREQEEQKAKGGIPGWVWISVGLFAMFMFAVIVLLVVYFFLLSESNFEVSVKGAPPGSDVAVDGSRWGVTRKDGDIELRNLKSGRRTVTISHPAYTCEPRDITGGDGIKPEPIIARCQAVAVQPGEDCTNIRLGEEDKAERCYNAALDSLPDPFTPEDLVRALNILIINFDSGKFDVPPRRLAALKKGAGFILKLPPAVLLEVGGHTDNVGRDDSNQTLSDNRANAVKQVLVGYGVRAEALQTRGYGAAKPKTDNTTEQGKFYNRRIEYSIVKK